MSLAVHSPRRWSYLVDSLLLIGLCLLFFWRDLTPVAADRRQFALGDFAYQYYAPAHYAAERLRSGELPLWNPYTYAGHPFAADIQNATFYPPRLLVIALAGGPELPYRALEIEALLHFPLAALSTYLLARRLTGSRAGGWVAAVAFTFSSYLTGYPILQVGILEAQAWLPLILLCLQLAGEALARADIWRAARWGIGAGSLLAVSWLAGSPQASLLVTYGALAFGLFRFWPRPMTLAWRVWRPRLAVLAAFGLVGFGLAAVQLAPSAEFMRLSIRSSIGFEEAGAGFMPYDLWQLVLPAVGVPFTALYLGVLPLGLAGSALFYVRRFRDAQSVPESRAVVFWGWSGLAALLLSFGKHLAVYSAFYLLAPGWSLFRQQERSVVWFVLAAALLAGYGAAWLTRREIVDELVARAAARLSMVFGIATGCAALLTTAFFVGFQAGREPLWGFTSAAALLTLLLGLSAVAVHSRRGALLIAVLALDLFTLNAANHSGRDQPQPFPAQPLLGPVQADAGSFRVVNAGVLPPTYGEVYGLEDTGGASQLRLAQYQKLLDTVPAPRAWQLLGVRYVLSRHDAVEAPAERLASQGGGAGEQPSHLYRLAQPGPRAWLAGLVVAEPDEARVWQRLAAADFDPARQVLLEGRPDGYADAAACDGRIAWQAHSPEFLSLAVETVQPCILVLSELDYPGWHAHVDGQGAAILRANGALRALALPAGPHQVEMRFRPTSLLVGAALSAFTLIAAIGLVIWPRGHGDIGSVTGFAPTYGS
jgi:hypothetical protein